MIRASAPGRCGVVGNPTDGYGGTVISASLAQRAVVEIRPAEQGITLEICGHTEQVRGPDDLALNGNYADVAKAVLQFLDDALQRSFTLRGTTTVPVQAGLAGSTAMLTAILGAVLRLLEIRLNPYQVAETERHIEFNILNCVCGFQDQYMAVFGGLNYLDFRGKDPHAAGDLVFGTVERLEPRTSAPFTAPIERPLEPGRAQLPLLLANTGLQRHSGRVHQGPRERWIAGDPAVVSGYERIAALAREAKKALLDDDWVCVGEAMNENHVIQRDLGGSGEANERLIRAALEAGARGAKLAGAGKGGTIIAVHEDLPYLARKLEDAGATHVLPVLPSEGLVVEGQV
jgi:galactokinase/mevalonate kinase-like predicted kinase